MFWCLFSLSISVLEVKNLTEQVLNVPFNVVINSEAKLSVKKSLVFFIYNPEGCTVEYPNGTTTNLEQMLYLPIKQNPNPTSDFIIRCEGSKTLRAVLFYINYYEMNEKYYILMNTYGKKLYLPSTDCIYERGDFLKVRVYVVSDVPCDITFYHGLDIPYPCDLRVYSTPNEESTPGFIGSNPEFTVNNVYFAYIEIGANFTNGQLVGVKNVQKSNPNDELPSDAIVYESFSNIINLDEPLYHEEYNLINFDHLIYSNGPWFTEYPNGIKAYETKGNAFIIQNYQDIVLGNGEDCPPIVANINGMIFKPRQGSFSMNYWFIKPLNSFCHLGTYSQCQCDTMDVVYGYSNKYFHYDIEKKEKYKHLRNCVYLADRGGYLARKYENANIYYNDIDHLFYLDQSELYFEHYDLVLMAHYPPNLGEFLLKEVTFASDFTANIGINEYQCDHDKFYNISYTGSQRDLIQFSSDKVGLFYDANKSISWTNHINDRFIVTTGSISKFHLHIIAGSEENKTITHIVANAQSQQIPRVTHGRDVWNQYYVLIFGDDPLEITFMRDASSRDNLSYLNSYYLDGEYTQMTSEKEEYTVSNTNFVILRIDQEEFGRYNGTYGIKEVKYMNPRDQNYNSISAYFRFYRDQMPDLYTYSFADDYYDYIVFGSCENCLTKVVVPDKVPEKKEENVPSGKYAMTPEEEDYKIGKGKLVVLSYDASQKLQITAKIGDNTLDVSGKKKSAVLFTEDGYLTISNKKNNNKKSQVFMYIYDISNYPPFDYWIFITGTQTIQAKDFGVDSKSLVGKRIAIFASFFKSTSTLNIKLPKGADAKFYSLDGSDANIRRHASEVEDFVQTEPTVSVITPSSETEVEQISFEIHKEDYPELAIEVAAVSDINVISVSPVSPQSPTPSSNDNKLSVGAIIGISVGSFAIIAIIIIVSIFIIKQKKKLRVIANDDSSYSDDENNNETNRTN
ncbi:hypothetical protein TVAG_465480 [Trichomonas vaginalis G3]|uniref:Uncharacterized protein n=1 Tax=Trichomonas vaginalis (strain ATCC PRA-98 / G3) TaxID=412133 RepID=A2DU13_TRIV3|nr:hypothetical protein TVAGG3_0718290 [Trichomonas vaginalis G3]EAY16160.1 hypothetical protein TVAG_465480 [Trichomonas vaginalis G3]KAI5510406.1 hypothetical protein TVAGG3_0718290 [Trichomonas vaginalis G3]|eukprot:XP_001328383.1 hypothetical protein [Trichomonas vaginalis G3]